MVRYLHFRIVGIALLLTLCVDPVTVFGQKKTRLIDYTSDILKGDKLNDQVKKLMGHVVFHDSTATMYCDSAYFYENQDFDAYGNIRIYPDQSGTELVGDVLIYKAEDRTADLTGKKVVLTDENAKLTTQSIFYNLNTGISYYTTPGTIVTDDNVITSDLGSYDKHIRTFFFKQNVVVTNPDYIINTDTMNYNTASKIVDFLGPTLITSDKDSIYCEKGWYNTDTDISTFRQNAWLKYDDKVVQGDTLYYEKHTGFGKGFGNVQIWDTTQNVIVKGNYATIDRPDEKAVVTNKALMIQVDNKDSLYLHADTIRTGIFIEEADTFKFMKAYYHVKFYRHDLQGLCDSMYYSFKDSTLKFIGEPVLWANDTQLTSEFMQVFTKNQKMDRLEMQNSSFIISYEDSAKYDQIKGRNTTCYFADNEIYRMNVKGNGQSIYFLKDKGITTAIQKAECSDIIIYLKDRKLSKVTYINSVNGTLYPPPELTGADLFLKDFVWHEYNRPKKWQDVFVWKKNTGL